MLLQGADLSKTGDSAWVKPQGTFLGVQFDTFSARVNPRAYLKALEKYAKAHCEVCEGVGVASIEFNEGSLSPRIALESGEYVTATKVAVANGWEAYPLLQAYLGQLNEQKPIGRGVKGQAVLLEHQHDDDLAIVYSDGVYVVPHAGNRVAVGSTSENEWSGKPNAFDEDNMEFYERAISLVPDLAQAPIVARWAGVRPRNTIKGRGTTPWLGPVADHEHLHALIGGFKITLGIAHLDYLSGAHSI